MKVYIVALLVLAAFTALSSADTVFIAQLTSEGARSPNGANIFEGRFPWGSGEVTSMGLRQHYLVGYDLYTNYREALGLDVVYNPWQVNVRSTNHNATLMCAQAHLEAIYQPNVRDPLREPQAKLAIPPGNNDNIQDEIQNLGNNIMPENFQTLPIHAFDFDKDTVLLGDWCHKIFEINNRTVFEDAEWIVEMEEKYKDALTALRTFLEDDELSIHALYKHIDAIQATLFNLDSLGAIDAHKDQLLAFGFEYLEKLWSNEESRKIFSNGFFIDLER
jgi:hypothetical protein